MASSDLLLSVKDLSVSYGAIRAVRSISFEIKAGEIVTLIGANGAGKSTVLNTLSGLIKPDTGSIVFSGENIAGVKSLKRVLRFVRKADGSSRV